MLKKITSAVLLAAIMSSVLAGCGSDVGEVTTAPDDTTEPTESTTELKDIDKLPDADYDGYTFKIYGEEKMDYFYAEQEDGEVVNDNIFRRNAEVSDRYNVKFDFTLVEWGNGPGQIVQNIMAGDNAFDLYTMTHLYLAKLLTGGYLRDWNDVPNVDLNSKYYVTAANDAYSIDGHTKLLFGDFLDSNLRKAFIMPYNKRLAEEYGIDGLYDAVDNGTWTIDYFSSLVKDIRKDLNGDSAYDENDFYGFGTDNYAMVDAWSKPLGFIAIDNSDGEPKLDFYKETTVDAYKKLYELYFDNPGVYGKFGAYETLEKMFAPGNCIFTCLQIGMLLEDEMRSMKDDYGVLPLPKLNERQEGYYTHLDGTYAAQMIAVTVPDEDLERTGTIVEALNAYSREYVIPALYDVALKVKASRDDDSVRMLDIALAGRRYSLDSMDENTFALSPRRALRDNIQKGVEDISSYYEANKASCEQWIKDMVDAFNGAEK